MRCMSDLAGSQPSFLSEEVQRLPPPNPDRKWLAENFNGIESTVILVLHWFGQLFWEQLSESLCSKNFACVQILKCSTSKLTETIPFHFFWSLFENYYAFLLMRWSKNCRHRAFVYVFQKANLFSLFRFLIVFVSLISIVFEQASD